MDCVEIEGCQRSPTQGRGFDAVMMQLWIDECQAQNAPVSLFGDATLRVAKRSSLCVFKVRHEPEDPQAPAETGAKSDICCELHHSLPLARGFSLKYVK